MNLIKWLDYQQQLHTKSIDLGLERIEKVYQLLFPNGVDFKVITIAGTNGKGSTGCFISNILNETNINYGWFSSPHIDKYNERFVINNDLATDVEIITAFEEIEKVRKNISLSYFEFSTLAALLIFKAKNIQVAILEIGLGGRLDSVNVVENDISIITSISLDHTDYLGDTIEKIAFEKAGVIKPQSHCIIPENLPKIILDIANQNKAKIHTVQPYQGLLSMTGGWQKNNAALAKTAISLLFSINPELISQGLFKAKLSSRAEIITYKNKNIMFDVAHNTDAVSKLATLITDDTIAIFAALGGKDIANMIKIISPKIAKWYIFPLTGDRALTNLEMIKYFNNEKLVIETSAKNILVKALDSKYKNILIFGSFLTIYEIKNLIK